MVYLLVNNPFWNCLEMVASFLALSKKVLPTNLVQMCFLIAFGDLTNPYYSSMTTVWWQLLGCWVLLSNYCILYRHTLTLPT